MSEAIWWQVRYIGEDGYPAIYTVQAPDAARAKRYFQNSKGKHITITSIETSNISDSPIVNNQITKIAAVLKTEFDNDRMEFVFTGHRLFAVDQHGIAWSYDQPGDGTWVQLPSLPMPNME